MIEAPPLSLYVHFPWCVRKCPYCDFNSHPVKAPIPEDAYLAQLLADLDQDTMLIGDRTIETIFFGGGTPSLISPRTIAALLDGIARRVAVARTVEVTLEANPGAVDATNFAAYRRAGVNRLSIGAQSFDESRLKLLGRIHGREDTERAVAAAVDAGFERFNLDLMHGLPGQSAADAVDDLQRAIALGATHVSWYQLTIEPRTEFALHRPELPDEDELEEIEAAGFDLLATAGFRRYEVSAFAHPGEEARHNLNYWTFGDYVGIGAGAHGKISFERSGEVMRTNKPVSPARYLGLPAVVLRSDSIVAANAMPGEFMLNALRLVDGVETASFGARTGCATDVIATQWRRQQERGLMRSDRLATTALGLRHLDSIVSEFL